jgi:hypothetical protein
MRANIMSKIAASLPRLSVADSMVLLVVLPVLAGQYQLSARAETGGAPPAVSPEAPTNAPDTSVVTRWTIDGGGGMAATGGNFELSGTFGQSDVGLAKGGDFTLAGGFWFPLTEGDCNTDGGVDLIDFNGFHPCLFGPGGGLERGCECFDVDQDDDVDLSDVAAFQHAFTGS